MFGRTTARMGAEVLSGERASLQENVTYSFVPLYGVAWKFMGNMNLFTRFPRDVNYQGLINPYLFILHRVSEKLLLRNDSHLFYTQHPLIDGNKNLAAKYLGFENDFSIRYTPLKKIEIVFGFSFLLPENSMELLDKVNESNKIPVWSYLMISYNPLLMQARK